MPALVGGKLVHLPATSRTGREPQSNRGPLVQFAVVRRAGSGINRDFFLHVAGVAVCQSVGVGQRRGSMAHLCHQLAVPCPFGLLAGSSICYLVERLSYGKENRQCEIDRSRGMITIQPQGFSDSVTIRFQDVISFGLISNRDDWYRLRRTFSPTFDYSAQDGRNCQIVLQRDTNRNRGVELFAIIKQFLDEFVSRNDWCDGRSTLVPELTNV